MTFYPQPRRVSRRLSIRRRMRILSEHPKSKDLSACNLQDYPTIACPTSHQSRIISHDFAFFVPSQSLSFQSITNSQICKSSVLISIQNAGGVGLFFPVSNSPLATRHSPLATHCYPLSFHALPHSLAQWSIRNSFPINHFRTLSHSTGGGGSRAFNRNLLKKSLPSFTDYGSRIHRSRIAILPTSHESRVTALVGLFLPPSAGPGPRSTGHSPSVPLRAPRHGATMARYWETTPPLPVSKKESGYRVRHFAPRRSRLKILAGPGSQVGRVAVALGIVG
jgi:hypothetical protein